MLVVFAVFVTMTRCFFCECEFNGDFFLKCTRNRVVGVFYLCTRFQEMSNFLVGVSDS